MEYPDNIGIGRPGRLQESRQRWLMALALEKLGDVPAARAELETLIKLSLRVGPFESYFVILALRKLGRDAEADQRLARMDRQRRERAGDPTAETGYWAKVVAAMAERARGDRDGSNRLLAELNPAPGDELTDYLNSELY